MAKIYVASSWRNVFQQDVVAFVSDNIFRINDKIIGV